MKRMIFIYFLLCFASACGRGFVSPYSEESAGKDLWPGGDPLSGLEVPAEEDIELRSIELEEASGTLILRSVIEVSNELSVFALASIEEPVSAGELISVPKEHIKLMDLKTGEMLPQDSEFSQKLGIACSANCEEVTVTLRVDKGAISRGVFVKFAKSEEGVFEIQESNAAIDSLEPLPLIGHE